MLRRIGFGSFALSLVLIAACASGPAPVTPLVDSGVGRDGGPVMDAAVDAQASETGPPTDAPVTPSDGTVLTDAPITPVDSGVDGGGDGCPTPCGTTGTCVGGICQCGGGVACAGGRSCCGSTCVLTVDNESHCGGCGIVCPTDQTCQAGVCTPSTPMCTGPCPTGETCVGTQCKCGTGPSCAAGTQCQAGSCVALPCGGACGTGQACCGGTACTDITRDDNCGGCGIVCGGGTRCCNGTCRSFDADPMNCGACGNACNVSAAGPIFPPLGSSSRCFTGQCLCGTTPACVGSFFEPNFCTYGAGDHTLPKDMWVCDR